MREFVIENGILKKYVGTSNFVTLRLHLFGEYNGPLTSQDMYRQGVQKPEEKSLEKAIALLPAYFASMYPEDAQEREDAECLFIYGYMRPRGYDVCRYLPDIELWELADDMEGAGYTREEIAAFATSFVKAMMPYEKVFRSAMHLLLFGKHISGIDIDDRKAKNFENALSFIPDYIDFLTGADADNYFSEGFVDLDEILHSFIQKMREENYREEDKLRFAAAWFDAIEAQGRMTLMKTRIYLFGRFRYTGMDYKTTDLLLPNKKNFEKAVANIPGYIAYMCSYSNPRWDDGVRISPKRTLENFLIPEMREIGYTRDEIETFCAIWREEMQKIPGDNSL